MKNAFKYLKIIATLSLSFYLTSMCLVQPAKASSTTNSYIGTNVDTTALSKMTLEQLKSSALPMPNNLLNAAVTGDYSNIQKNQQFIPQDGNIYYITSTFLVPTSGVSKISVVTTTTYYKFLSMYPGVYPHVNFYIYYWQFKDGVLQIKDATIKDISNQALYKQALTGVPYPNASTSVYSDKRLSTMFDMASEINPVKLDNAIISTGTSFADSLSGTVLAAKLKAPIFFINTDNDSKVYEYVNSNIRKGGTIYILGKEGAVGADIANHFTQSGYIINRLGGATRYDTCEQINNMLNVAQSTPVIIASGENYPDALSISSVAAVKGYPILLTQYDNIPEQTIRQLKKIRPSRIYVIGGTGVISNTTSVALKSYSGDVTRISGADRYETSINICKSFNLDNNITIVLATGTDFKDALSGSTVAAKYGSPMLLINSDISKTKDYLDTSTFRNLIILGDTKSISTDTESALLK